MGRRFEMYLSTEDVALAEGYAQKKGISVSQVFKRAIRKLR